MRIPKLIRKLDARGISHIIVPLLVVAVIGAAGTYVLVASHADSATKAGKSSATTTKKLTRKQKANRKIVKGAPVQFIVNEIVTSADGKTTKLVKRGNVAVQLRATPGNKNGRCRDNTVNGSGALGNIYKRAAGSNVVFKGAHTDPRVKNANHGMLKIDKCSPGSYVASINVNDAKYDIIAPATISFKLKNAKKQVTFTIKKKAAAANDVGTPGTDGTATLAAGTPGGPSSTTPTPLIDQAPAPVALTEAQEDAAYAQVQKYEDDMFGTGTKTCVPTDDMGDVKDTRIKAFAAHSPGYFLGALSAQVNAQAAPNAGDAFQLLKISDIVCGQYQNIERGPVGLIDPAADGLSGTVKRYIISTARKFPANGMTTKTDAYRIDTYKITRSSATSVDWVVNSIDVATTDKAGLAAATTNP